MSMHCLCTGKILYRSLLFVHYSQDKLHQNVFEDYFIYKENKKIGILDVI